MFKKFFPVAPLKLLAGPATLTMLALGSLGSISLTALVNIPAQADQQNAGKAEIDAFSLYQTSAVMGDKDVFVSTNAIKINDRKSGVGLVAKAPAWKVFVINQHSRRVCSYSLIKYPGIGKEVSGITGGITLGALPLKRGAKSTISGVAAISCETNDAFQTKQQKDLERGFAGPRFVKWGQLLIADQGPLDKVPKQAKTIMCRFYGVPEFSGQGLPLQFKYVDLADVLHTLLLTNGSKSLKLPANTFDPPADFMTVADMSKLDDRPKVKDLGPTAAIEVMKKKNIH